MFAPNPEVSLYCVRIIGNILAERDDFSEIFMKYQILDRVSVLLHNQSISVQGEDASLRSNRQTMRKDIFWLLVEIGEEYETDDDDQMADRNPFTSAIVNSRLKTYIHAKTYNKNVEISNISF